MAEFRLLTGHDCLSAHLYRFNLTDSPFCVLCASGQVMGVSHPDECSVLESLDWTVKKYWLFKKGKSYREIVKIVGRSHSCVQKIIGKFKSDELIKNKRGRGRKSILSNETKRKVLKDIKIDPKLRAVKLVAETSRIMGRSVNA
ncbi:HTH_Tnp_Tc3_2 domain-containing protein [Trichonephila clavipes]|nr:HTH_Tnp_Tc3_2 domain-containing protein [Trichonephila clavipes]